MFVQNKCLVTYCKNNALSTFDQDGNLTEEKSYCLDHIPNPGQIKQQIYEYIKNNDKIIGLNACGLIFKDINLSNKQLPKKHIMRSLQQKYELSEQHLYKILKGKRQPSLF